MTAATVERVPAPRDAIGRRAALALETIVHGQHPSGEMLSFRRDERGNYTYVRSPFLSTFVHDTLACLDPTSPGWLEGGLDLFDERSQGRVLRAVPELRRRIRAFLIWQQEPDGRWRFFGRGSGIDPDVNSTACALRALREGHGARSLLRGRLEESALLGFASAEGPYFTFLKPGRGGYGWLSEAGLPVVGFEPVVNAEVLRVLCSTGRDARPVADWLVGGVSEIGPSPLYPNPVASAFVLARALEEPHVPRRDELSAAALRLALGLQHGDGGFGGPLSTALGASAVLALGQRGEELAAARLAVLRGWNEHGAWGYEDFVVHGFGSPAWTTALSLAFLVREHCVWGAGV